MKQPLSTLCLYFFTQYSFEYLYIYSLNIFSRFKKKKSTKKEEKREENKKLEKRLSTMEEEEEDEGITIKVTDTTLHL